VQEVRWEDDSTEPAGEYIFFYGKEKKNHKVVTVSLCIRKAYQHLRAMSVLMIGCHTCY
jgi:hypothetical protein